MDKIINLVCTEFEVTPDDLKGRSRTGGCRQHKTIDIVTPRQVAMYIGWQHTELMLSEIGAALGNRTPATVSFGYNRIAVKRKTDRALHYRIQAIEYAFKHKPVKPCCTKCGQVMPAAIT